MYKNRLKMCHRDKEKYVTSKHFLSDEEHLMQYIPVIGNYKNPVLMCALNLGQLANSKQMKIMVFEENAKNMDRPKYE